MSCYTVTDYRLQRWEGYKNYHVKMMMVGDCDPAYPALCYVADRFELNIEQRFWIAWLYACCYCAATVYYIWNEFPDYENVDTRRLERWWSSNKKRLLFQTDRAKVKNFDLLVKMYESYRDHVGTEQLGTFRSFVVSSPQQTYENIYAFASDFYYMGRYSLFLYLEAMNRLTGLPMRPTGLDLRNAESCRNGLCYACGKDEWVERKLSPEEYEELFMALGKLHDELVAENPDLPIDYWNIETSLCAWKKLFWQTRYLGYYIDRQAQEIQRMERNVPEGVDWSVLWDFRREYFHPAWRVEDLGEVRIRKERLSLLVETGKLIYPGEELGETKRFCFPGAEEAYGGLPWQS